MIQCLQPAALREGCRLASADHEVIEYAHVQQGEACAQAVGQQPRLCENVA